ncbi:Octanoyltransferase [Trichinella pseudospiralis]
MKLSYCMTGGVGSDRPTAYPTLQLDRSIISRLTVTSADHRSVRFFNSNIDYNVVPEVSLDGHDRVSRRWT